MLTFHRKFYIINNQKKRKKGNGRMASMEKNSKLIQSTFSGILSVTVISIVSGVLCVMIDAIVTGQFLGKDAVAATGLINPVVQICGLFGSLFGPGLGVVCTRYMGMARQDRVKQVFSVAMIALTAICAVVVVALFAAAPAIAGALGAGASDTVRQMMTDYMRGYAFGIVPMSLSISLTGLMMLDNDQKRGIVTMGVTLAADIVFDLANAVIFHGGMWGMAIATSLSNLMGFLVLLAHFRKKDRILGLTRQGLRPGDIREVMLCGIPNAISMGSQALRGFCYNALLLAIAGAGAVASMSVCNSAFSIINAVALGLFSTTSTICSLLYREEDRRGMEQALGLSLRTVLIVFAAIAAALLLLAGPVAGMFVDPSAEAERYQGARFIRFMALQYLFGAVSYSLSGAYQGTRRLSLNYLIDVLREGVFPILSVLALGKLLGLAGVELGFAVSGILVLLFCVLLPCLRNRRFSLRPGDMLLLPEDFGPKPEELFEAAMGSMEDVMKVSGLVMAFCREKGAPKRVAYMTSLFVEEMAGNTVSHGFREGKPGSIDLRLIYRADSQVIRLRDNGAPFDPADWLRRNHPEDPASGAGIRIIVGLAKDVTYVPAMGLNNLVITI